MRLHNIGDGNQASPDINNFILRQGFAIQEFVTLLLACAKSHMLSASRRQPHLLHVSAVDRRQIWSMDKS